jgi:hypothetical protein
VYRDEKKLPMHVQIHPAVMTLSEIAEKVVQTMIGT